MLDDSQPSYLQIEYDGSENNTHCTHTYMPNEVKLVDI